MLLIKSPAALTSALLLSAVIPGSPATVRASDNARVARPAWPQWGGPNRNFTIDDPGFKPRWSEGGPPVLWRRPIGDGYSCMVSDGQRLFTMHRAAEGPHRDRESVIAIDAADGRTLWEHSYAAPYIDDGPDRKQTSEFGAGPNSTPLLVDGRLYTVGFTGQMHCLDADSGRIIWTRSLYRDMKGSFLICGNAASPIAYRDTVIVPVGGAGRGLVALDQRTGTTVWQGADQECSYATPALTTVGGRDHLIAYMRGEVIGVDPVDGRVQWSIKHRNPMNDNCICTPLACPGDLLYVANFGETAGGRMLKLSLTGDRVSVADVWTNKKLTGGLSDCVRVGDCLYGPHASKSFVVFNIRDGEIRSQSRNNARSTCVLAGRRMLLLNEDGELMLGTPKPDGVDIACKVKLLEKQAWTAPTVVGTRAFLRDRKTIMAVELG